MRQGDQEKSDWSKDQITTQTNASVTPYLCSEQLFIIKMDLSVLFVLPPSGYNKISSALFEYTVQ